MTSPPVPRLGWVQLAGRDTTLDQVRNLTDPRLFEAAKTSPGYGRCLCTVPPQRLVIRLRSGRYHLAGWPDEGARHHLQCPFFKLPADLTGRSAYAASAITEQPDGTYIRLHQPLIVRPGEEVPAAEDTDSSRPAGRSRNAISLLGLLHWLWEQAGLNQWQHQAGRRGWPDVHAALAETVTGCVVNGRALDTLFYVPVPFTPHTRERADAAFNRFTAMLGEDRASRHRRGLILGEIRDIGPTPYGERIALRHTKTPIFAAADVMARARRAYRPAFAAFAAAQSAKQEPRERDGRELPAAGSRQIALLLVNQTARGNLVAVDLCVMLTSDAYIPADSMHEVRMADRLVRDGRDFIKPCRYDADEEVFPDFVLTDVITAQGPTPAYIEVWGITGRESYERRRREKEQHYRRSGAVLIGWDVTAAQLADVALPPRRRSPSSSQPKPAQRTQS